ncbi:flagellar basal body rod protein FlgB, partial [Bacillus velezensis]
MSLFSGTIQNLENAMSRADIKQKVITNNIANIDTPNYKANKVSFQNLLDQESSRLEAIKTDYRHVDFSDTDSNYSIVASGDTSY